MKRSPLHFALIVLVCLGLVTCVKNDLPTPPPMDPASELSSDPEGDTPDPNDKEDSTGSEDPVTPPATGDEEGPDTPEPTNPGTPEGPGENPPADEPPANEPPTNEPPANEPPASEPPASEPPANEPPANEPPANEPPTSEPPANEPPVAPGPAEQPAPVAVVYHVSIPASMGGAPLQTKGVTFGSDGQSISSTFDTTDNIYVYNVTQSAFACGSTGDPLPLHPDRDGKSSYLTGDLSFYKYENSAWAPVTVGENDTYQLFYLMNNPNAQTPANAAIDFSGQTGSTATAAALNYALATSVTMTLSGQQLTVNHGTVSFVLGQSMFRQRLTFKDNGTTVTPTITFLTISTQNGTLVRELHPLGTNVLGDITIANPVIDSNGDIYLSLTFDYSGSHTYDGDQLILTAQTSAGTVFECRKNIPSTGFANGKYYYGLMTLSRVFTRSGYGEANNL